MKPEFSKAIDLIIDFWKEFSESQIRNIYNYVKHKGTPSYKKIEALKDSRFFDLIIGNESYSSDIRKILFIDEMVETLRVFDDEQLYPYVFKLLHSLKVNPSSKLL
ncbi:TPA: hypothetical protein QFG62_001107 [Enterococcus faecium]|nr:hypothetical protein [Enterococcus faecium]PQB79909.1 hypothetical protein CUN36_01570 [Enterococcus faecium]